MSVKDRVAKFREEKGWSRTHLGTLIGVCESMVGHVECGRRRLGVASAVALERLTEDWGEGPIRVDEWVPDANEAA